MADGSGRVTWSNAAAHAFFKREIQSGVSVALLFENVVIDADSSVARLLRQASEAKSVCSDMIEGPDRSRLTVQRCGQDSFLWRLQDRDRVTEMNYFIKKW
ncbi:hypothetical protein OAL97_00330 [Paracoccaceae bacterium]|jgi:hypothetical protein|nr:hypothetical protein [Paracoccaceae bacterium]